MGERNKQGQNPKERSPLKITSAHEVSPSRLRLQRRPPDPSSSLQDGIPSHYFTPRKAFSIEVASSPLISDLEMDTLTAECGDMITVVEGMNSEEEGSPVKMGPPSTQKYHAAETPNTKKDRELRQMLLRDLECSESERDTPLKKDSPIRLPVANRAALSPEETASILRSALTEAPVLNQVLGSTPVASGSGLVASKSMSRPRVESSSSSEEDTSKGKTDESSGDELDVHSSNFNPQKALSMGRKFLPKLPFPLTKTLNSLAQYSQVATACENKPEDFEKHLVKALKDNKSPTKRNPNSPKKIQRNFQPHQMPVASTFWSSKTNINLISRIEKITGPLAKLIEYRDKKIRVMIKTRNIYQGTNDMVAYVAAFDKHWNLALTDVEETFLRKRRRKVPVNLGETVKMAEIELSKRGLVRPKVIKKVSPKLELCKRHLPQLLLRGEQIVVIYPVV